MAGLICMKFSGKMWSDHGTTWLNFGSIRVNGLAGQRSICLLSPAIAGLALTSQYHSLGGSRRRGLLCLAPQLVATTPVSAVSTRCHLRSAGQGDLVVPRTRTDGFGPQSFSVAGPSAWNSLSPEIKTTSLTLWQFSGRLKTEKYLCSYYASAQPS